MQLRRYLANDWQMLFNASSLVLSNAAVSGLGFVYWWFAARLYKPADIGLVAAAVSAMILIGTISVMGFPTLLISEMARSPKERGSILITALVTVGSLGFVAGTAFAVLAPLLSTDLKPFSQDIQSTAIFASAVALHSIGLALDQALIGLLRSELQLWRNILYSTFKLILLPIVMFLFASNKGVWIFGFWTLGNLLSFAVLAGIMLYSKLWTGRLYRFQWSILRRLGSDALQHQIFNITLQIPGMILPLIVTSLLSIEANAHFYVSWMIYGILGMIPVALTTVLYAMVSANPDTLMEKTRLTLGLSLGLGLLGSIVLMLIAQPLLSLFGASYAQEASASLSVLCIGVLPLSIRLHFVAISRIRKRIIQATMMALMGGAIDIICSVIGIQFAGLFGLSLGWVFALFIEASLMGRTVYRTIRKSPEKPLTAN